MATADKTPEKQNAEQFLAQTLTRLPGGQAVLNISIGNKLLLGFGIVVFLTLIVVGLSFLSSSRASSNIDTTSELRAPMSLTSAQAQSDLLTMLAEVRGYLALGDEAYRDGYEEARQAFEGDLANLQQLVDENPNDPSAAELNDQLNELQAIFDEWVLLPEQLFNLRDDPLLREPAVRQLIEDANPLINQVSVATRAMMQTQQQREATEESIELLGDLANFQSSFFTMVSALRSYVTTGNNIFKFEYETNAGINEEAWEKLTSTQSDAAFSLTQLEQRRNIALNRTAFLELAPLIIETAEGERAREDLYLFRTEAVPLAEQMLQVLNGITVSQQELLQSDLSEGNEQLATSQQQNLLIGLVVAVVAIGLSYLIYRSIAGPVERLTLAADDLGGGNLEARASVESDDEIGTLALTFNSMAKQLGQTMDDLEQRRREEAAIAKMLRHQNEYLSALHQTTLGLMSRLDLDELLVTLMARAAGLLQAQHGFICLVAADGAGDDEMIQTIGLGLFEEQVGEVIKPGEGIAGKVWQNNEPMVIDDYDSWDGRLDSFDYNVIGTAVAVPLIRPTPQFAPRPDATGVLSVAYDPDREHEFGDDELELLTRFSELASIAIDNARLYTSAQEARAEAEQANATKSAFMASMSHELRTPLNHIMGFTRIVRRKGKNVLPERQIDNLNNVLNSAQHLLGLINTVLDIAKIEAGQLDVLPGEFEIGKLVNACSLMTQTQLKPGVTLEQEIELDLALVYSDQDKVKQILLNLLSNAAKFTNEGSVTIKASALPHETGETPLLEVSVIDTGIGISAEALSRIFEEFEQAESTTQRDYGGTGLGLSISRKLAGLLGGDLTATSVLEEGSTFTLTIPMRYEEM